ncbi:protein BCL9 homolog [Haematobia irritans]|uniref:protein BCL9 homolog n=1 Tax=Haematobia irritans TaxID=7368 RepID=UPI003F4F650A
MDSLEDNVRQTPDISSFPEQKFSESSSNNGEGAPIVQNTKTANNSPSEEDPPSFPKTESSPMALEGDIDNLGNSNASSTAMAITSPNSKIQNQVSMSKVNTNANAPIAKSVREEKDIKKEEITSPSPPGKTDDNANEESQERSKSVGSAAGGANITPNLDGVNSNIGLSPNSNSDVFNSTSNMQNLPRNLNPFNGSNSKFPFQGQGDGQGMMNSSNCGGGGGGGDFMQQQNHVFVFSTQLANKSADAVLSGQFPTIIAYHCMQPSTKLFLEDFLKNPTKTSKQQRQYSMNIMNLMQSGGLNRPGGQAFWLNECNNSNKMPQRQTLRNAGANKNSPVWDQNTTLDNKVGNTANPLEGFDPHQICGIKEEDKSNIPSLQGVKVPDENLTPQQRQHREEQLAKLKKMNKFLFPENEGNDIHPPLANNSTVTSESSTGNLPGAVEALLASGSESNNSGNVGKYLTPGKGSIENVPNLGDDPTVGDASNMGAMQAHKQGCIPKMDPNTKPVNARGRLEEQINTNMESNQDIVSSFNLNNCPQPDPDNLTRGNNVSSNIPMTQEEWSKFQNSQFGDNFKFKDSKSINNPGVMMDNPISGQQNSSLSRSLSIGVSGFGLQSCSNAGPSPTNRSNNGPPPPYHQTQRSASVPISTQSPTHPNSNNVNPDIGLSPHGPRPPFGISSTPPIVDGPNSTVPINNPTNAPPSSFGNNVKNIYSRDGSNLPNPNQMFNSHSTSALNNMSSNPASHTLSHMSHAEMDSMNPCHKLKRNSPQKSKSPLINEMQTNPGMESKYTNFGLNYPNCGMPPMNTPNMRQNMQMPPQFRRTDNIPLNPNCNRVNQNKAVSNFDPIASLAQMSQQLTGSAMGLSSIGGGGNNSSLMDGNTGEMMGGPPSGRVNDHSMDHCNQMPGNSLGMMGGLGVRSGQFPPDINSMDPMDQRMLNGKLGMPPGHFNHNTLTGVGLRDSNMPGNEMMSSNRSIMPNRRMPNNFDNFNMSSNVHIRASAPNTIQYMPARAQNMNNMRVPPNMEFFQRYPHGNMGAGNPSGHINNEMTNPNMMNMFGNCGPNRGGGGFDQNDLGVDNNLMPNDAAFMNVP